MALVHDHGGFWRLMRKTEIEEVGIQRQTRRPHGGDTGGSGPCVDDDHGERDRCLRFPGCARIMPTSRTSTRWPG